jgi:epoxyqueuosine reductase
MSGSTVHRRDFLKIFGAGAAAGLGNPALFAEPTEHSIRPEEEHGEFEIEKVATNYYRCNPEMLRPISQKTTVFSRNMWDPVRQERPRENLRHQRLVEGQGKIANQTRLDYALYDGAWAFSYMGGGEAYDWGIKNTRKSNLKPWEPEDLDMTWAQASDAVKHAALFYGASVAGIAELNPLWIYSDNYAPTRKDRQHAIPVVIDQERFEKSDKGWFIPRSMNRVISLAFEEDFFAIANSPGRLASAATGNGYSRMAFTSRSLAEFIRSLGYRAIPAGNGVGLSIPIAIDAGLGELGRMGLLVTPKYGPRVRLAKVITDMPLMPDSPIRFGVTEFCDSCMLCADHCPSGSISKGPQTWEGKSLSTNPGVFKWYVEPESCYDYNGFSCSNCKRVCPFTKPNNEWLHRMIRTAIKGRIAPLNRMMVTLDQASGYGLQIHDSQFWKMNGQKSITARESM